MRFDDRRTVGTRGWSRKVFTPSSSSARSAVWPSFSQMWRPHAVQLCSTRVLPRVVTSMLDIGRRQQARVVVVVDGGVGEVIREL